MRVEIVESTSELGQTLSLRKRGEAYDVILGNVVLLSSAALETEIAFGRLPERVEAPRRVLIGGLGFGGTLRGALAVCPPDAEILVAEKLEALERWLRGPLSHLAENCLQDARVTIVREDVSDVIARERDLDAILLDVDNGPAWASFRTNARLYGAEGLRVAHAALRPGGLYAVWSGYPADAFVGVLRRAGFRPETVPFEERGIVRARAYVGMRT
jgi:predicted membrane-bound spermidine synthase